MDKSNNISAGGSSAPVIDQSTTTMSRMRISGNNTASSSMYVAERFPVNSLQQITVLPDHEVITGRVYCTDEITRTVVLQKSLTYTTLSSEIRIISLNGIVQSLLLPEKDGAIVADSSNKEAAAVAHTVRATPLTQPLPIIQKKALEERERRAVRLAEESLRHINPKASPVGQAVFERLLKACGEVEWKDDTTSILVLKQIQVDAPYEPINCTIVQTSKRNTSTPQPPRNDNGNNGVGSGSSSSGTSLEDVSLERVKKIVASAIGTDTVVAVDNGTTTNATTANSATVPS